MFAPNRTLSRLQMLMADHHADSYKQDYFKALADFQAAMNERNWLNHFLVTTQEQYLRFRAAQRRCETTWQTLYQLHKLLPIKVRLARFENAQYVKFASFEFLEVRFVGLYFKRTDDESPTDLW